jgi:2-polyprenyl-3-methyl-5-hydroxy-6-metoxy-1,4-benzoquinol methylase
MSLDPRVKRHFEADAERFDAIYDEDKGPFTGLIDNFWRGVVQRRLDLSLQYLEPLDGKSILDVGCGSGRFCVAYAQRGATRVVGVDFAESMIEIAEDAARRAQVADRCEFRIGSFPEAVTDGPFDASTANGFFDYVADPLPILVRMRELTRSTMIMSFPKVWEWRAPVRRVRFWRSGCPLYLYTEKNVTALLRTAGVLRYELVRLDRDYLVVARP